MNATEWQDKLKANNGNQKKKIHEEIKIYLMADVLMLQYVYNIFNGNKLKDKRISRSNTIHKLSGVSRQISEDAVTIALQVYSSLAIAVLSGSFCSEHTHSHPLWYGTSFKRSYSSFHSSVC